MAHFHSSNSWAHKLVYLPSLEELADELGPERRAKSLHHWQACGKKLDLYVIRGDALSPDYSIGLRYGAKPEEYLPIWAPQHTAKKLFNKYKGQEQ